MFAHASAVFLQEGLPLFIRMGIHIADEGSERRLRIDDDIFLVGVVQHHTGSHTVVRIIVAYYLPLRIPHHILHIVFQSFGEPELIQQVVELHLTEVALHLWTGLEGP